MVLPYNTTTLYTLLWYTPVITMVNHGNTTRWYRLPWYYNVLPWFTMV